VLLSAAMIVRDEAEHLDACLSSLRGLVDEIVVVDTGSQDHSLEVARRHGAVTAQQRWEGDFSKPRNRSLDLASGDWILYIDADERARAPDPAGLRALLRENDEQAAFRVRFIPRRGWTPYYEYRLWRHAPDLRFQGNIHESLWSSLHARAERDDLAITETDLITIEHLGYEGDQSAKHARNEQMLISYLERDPTRIYCYDHLARIYEDRGQDDRAVTMWMRGIEVARSREHSQPDDRLLWVNLIVHKLARRALDDELVSLVAEGLERFPGLPALELAAASHEFALGKPALAVPRLEWLTSLDLEDVVATGSSYDQRVLGEWAWHLLGLCRYAIGDAAGAADAFGRAEACAPENREYTTKRRLAHARAGMDAGR
jgi:glycosyltransferase involved in cell wall biosynthesis